jgi:predicted transcriptional regulator
MNLTKSEQLAAIKSLPEISAKVFLALLDGLYAEPGFSDVDVKDLAKMTKLTVAQVKGAVGHLVNEGLVYTFRMDGLESGTADLIYANCHSNGVDTDGVELDFKDEARAAASHALMGTTVAPASIMEQNAKMAAALAPAPAHVIPAADIPEWEQLIVKMKADPTILPETVAVAEAKVAEAKAALAPVIATKPSKAQMALLAKMVDTHDNFGHLAQGPGESSVARALEARGLIVRTSDIVRAYVITEAGKALLSGTK